MNVASFLCGRSVNDLSRKLDDDYKREIDEIYKRLSAKNQEKLADLLAAQQEEEEEMRERIKDLSPKVRGRDILPLAMVPPDDLELHRNCDEFWHGSPTDANRYRIQIDQGAVLVLSFKVWVMMRSVRLHPGLLIAVSGAGAPAGVAEGAAGDGAQRARLQTQARAGRREREAQKSASLLSVAFSSNNLVDGSKHYW